MNRFILVTVMSAAVLSQLSCGAQQDPGANIGISVSPESAYIVPGKGISCVSRTTAKADDSIPVADIDGDRVSFNRFALQWRSGDQLTISSMTATFFSPGISGAEGTEGTKVEIGEEELIALLGLSNLTLGYADPYPGPDGVTRVQTIDSAATNKAAPYTACGLQLGGIASSTTIKSYSARIKFEIIGFGQKCDTKEAGVCTGGAQYPVRQTVTVRAQKY